MASHVYKKVELVGSSKVSTDDAIQTALARAAKTIHNMDWYEVIEHRGHIEDGKVSHFQVILKVGFRLND